MAQYEVYNLDLEFIRNDSINIDISFVDADGVNVPAATFTSAKCEVRKSRNQTPILTFDTSDSSLVLTDGNINLNKLNTLTDIKAGLYKFDIEFLITSGTQVATLIRGDVNVIDDRTQ